jgi:hypothetical protein
MVLYEVNIEVDSNILNNYLIWLKKHLQEMLTIDGFKTAKILMDIDYENCIADFNYKMVVVLYEVESEVKVNNYFQNQAPKMRQQTIDTFGDKVRVSRRVLKLTETC